jgi:hypothetical protein
MELNNTIAFLFNEVIYHTRIFAWKVMLIRLKTLPTSTEISYFGALIDSCSSCVLAYGQLVATLARGTYSNIQFRPFPC